MADLEYDIKVDAKQALGQLKKMQMELKGMRQDMRKTDRASGGASKGLGNLKVAAGLAAAAFAAFKAINIAGEFEKLQAVLKSVTGSQKEAALAFKFVQDIAKGLPFSLQEITTAYTKMTALGIQPTREALESFANTAAATGKSLDQFVEAVADAVTGEFERLKEFGIKVKNEGDTLKVTFQGITKTIQNDAAAINGYLQSIGENQFAGAAADQMDTLTGRWSVFTDEVSKFANDFANTTGLLDLAKDSLVTLTEALEWAREAMVDIKEFVAVEIPQAFETWIGWLGLTSDQVSSFGMTVKKIFGGFATFIKAVFTDTRHLGVAMIDGLVSSFFWLGQQWDLVVEAMDFAWGTTIASIQNAWGHFIEFMKFSYNNTIAAIIPGFDEIKVNLENISHATESWDKRMARVNDKWMTNNAEHKKAIDLWHQDIEAQNKIKELEKERARIQEELDLKGHNEELHRRQRELNANIKAEKEAAAAQKEFNDTIKETVKEGEKLAETYRKWKDPLAELEKLEQDLTMAFDEGKLAAEDYMDALAQLDRQRDDINDKALDDSKEWIDGWTRAFQDYSESAMDAASNAERFFNNTMSGMEDALVDFVKTGKLNWEDLVSQILEDLIRIQIRKSIAGIFGAGGNGGGGGGLFAGLFAQGGMIPAGQFGIVGERGPELVSGPAQVTPMAQVSKTGAGGGDTYNVNITALDQSSVNDILARDPSIIFALAEEGKRNLPFK